MASHNSAADFKTLVFSPVGLGHPALAIAACRAGGIGVLDAEFEPSAARIAAQLELLRNKAGGAFGLRAGAYDKAIADLAAGYAAAGLAWLIIGVSDWPAWKKAAASLRKKGLAILLETQDTAWPAGIADSDADGWILKGNEAAGFVGESSGFILLQKWLEHTGKPLYLRGGVSVHSAAACRMAGLAGVALDSQVLLLAESPVAGELEPVLRPLSGNEASAAGSGEHGVYFRLLVRPGYAQARQFLADADQWDEAQLRSAVQGRVEWHNPAAGLLPLGQDVCFAGPWSQRYGTVASLIRAIEQAAASYPAIVAAAQPVRQGGPLAQDLGTPLPLVQGPMSRVSDKAEFALAVAENGALPMLALALLKGEPLHKLLRQTRDLLGDKPWGIGLLGFAPQALLDEQIAASKPCNPSFAIIAGGRPDQANQLERSGIPAFLHVPSANLIPLFLQEGARRFIFEGRECGGHVGPLSSFVLWSSMVDTLAAEIDGGVPAGQISVLFAGGIHDALSSAVVQTLAAPLLARGVKLGLLMGSAYLFTREIVESGAIVQTFQEEVAACRRTVNLESGTGHASRCAYTPFAEAFFAKRRELREAGVPAGEAREILDDLILGRLRLASKGNRRSNTDGVLQELSPEEQRRDGMYMLGQVATLRQEVTDIASLHRAVSADAGHKLEQCAAEQRPDETLAGKPADIAIIGMGAVLPGAHNTREFWENILDKVDAISEIPAHRWDWRLYFDADRNAPDKVYSRWGGFLDDMPFDPTRYGITPKSLESVDPIQLMALEVARQTLADAGYEGREFDRERVSVIIGASGGAGDVGMQYGLRSELPRFQGDLPQEVARRLPEWSEDTFAGILLNVISGRIANRLNLGGVNFATDAACASSLAAIYQAVSELTAGRSDLAIAGGVDTVQGPFGYLCFSKTQALSPRGRCSTFDQSADGIVISEGIAMLALKRLEDAERDGDRVYAVIKGIGGGSDGKARGLTAPLPAGQLRAMRRAYQQAGFSPDSVGLFEAHGTGTVAGDTAELESTTQLLREAGGQARQSVVGSVKTMIGHTKATAGVAGLVKAALALHHRTLPPHRGVENPNAVLADAGNPLYLLDQPSPWLAAAGQPRRAAVSAFGFGGTNFHAVLEEYPGEYRPWLQPATRRRWPAELLLWQAEDRAALQAQVQAVQTLLAGRPGLELRHLACQLNSQRGAGPEIAAVVATDQGSLASQLEALAQHLGGAENKLPAGVYGGRADAAPGKIAVLFPGQGSQQIDMLRELALHFPALADTLAEADALLAPAFERRFGTGRRLSQFIYPRGCYGEAARKQAGQALTSTDVAQPALGAVEAGLWRLLQGFGLQADMLAGHSYGEFVALFAGGWLGFDGLMGLSEARGRLIVDAAAAAGAELGSMAMVQAERAAVEQAVAGIAGVLVANHNAPLQSIISGSEQGISQAMERLAAAGCNVSRLPVAAAFHSPFVAPAQTELAKAIAAEVWQEGALPVYSNTSAEAHSGDFAVLRQTMAEHLVRPVEFVAEIEAMYRDGARIFLELGPKAVTSRLAGRILEGQPHHAIAVDDQGGGIAGLLHALARLLCLGVPLDLSPLFAGRDCRPAASGRLEDLCPPEVLPAHAWLLNGSVARRAGTPAKQVGVTLEQAQTAPTPQPAPPSSDSRPEPTIQPVAAETGRRPIPAIHHQPRKVSAMSDKQRPYEGDSASVMAEYFATMRQFLETQERVISAYMGADSGTVPLARSLPARPQRRPIAVPAMPMPELAAPQSYAMPAPPPVAAAPVPTPAPAPVAVPAAASPAPAAAVAAPAPAASQGRWNRQEMADKLLAIVADRTGYPSDMVGLEQNLEADLGIDSIKRVEIVGAFLQALPASYGQALGDARGELNTRQTLKDMLNLLEGLELKEAVAPFELAGTGSRAVAADSHPSRHIVRAEAEAVDSRAAKRLQTGHFVLTDDGRGVAAALQAWLGQQGCSSSLLAAELLADEAALLQACAGIAATHDEIAGVLHLAPIGAPWLALNTPAETWRRQLQINEKSLFLLVQALQERLQPQAHVLAANALGGNFGRGDAALADGLSLQGGGIGFIKSLHEELPQLRVRAVDLDPSQTVEAMAASLAGELELLGGRLEVGYPGGQRTVFRTVAADLAGTGPATPLQNLVVLATGGARGITAEVLRGLACPGNTLLLTGRSAFPEAEPAALAALQSDAQLRQHFIGEVRAGRLQLTPAEIGRQVAAIKAAREMQSNVADFRARGATVEYFAVDVTDEAAMRQLLETIYTRHGRIDGVVHGAGVIEDKLVKDKTSASWSRVVDTKVGGLLLLQKYLRPEGLKFFSIFSSVAGRYGNSGQSDYATANELMNRLCSQLQRHWQGRVNVNALNWGPWGATQFGAGMVNADTEAKFAAKGVALVSATVGTGLFVDELRLGAGQPVEIICGAGPWEQSEAEMGQIVLAESTAAAGDLDQPMLTSAKATAGEKGTQLVEIRLDQRHAYLQEHCIDGIPVLPAAAALEIMAETVDGLWPGWRVVEAHDCRLLKGVQLADGAEALTLLVQPATYGSSEGFEVGVTLRSGSPDKPRPHYRAAFTLAQQLPAAMNHARRKHSEQALAVERAYNDWLFHGPRFQVIESITGLSAAGAGAVMRRSTPQGWLASATAQQQWIFDPAIVDAAAQMALLWARATRGGSALPAKFGHVLRFAEQLPERFHMDFLCLPADNNMVKANVYFTDDAGRILLLIEDMECIVDANLNRLGGTATEKYRAAPV
jgi:acyl transferase domain-containing protein/NADP-dependent 3-hydroxy acid dehydrogenase YdfG